MMQKDESCVIWECWDDETMREREGEMGDMIFFSRFLRGAENEMLNEVPAPCMMQQAKQRAVDVCAANS
jgi:hypothetical protein